MKIISKFHDYYDGVRRYGFDPSIVYVRDTVEVKRLPSVLQTLLARIPNRLPTDYGQSMVGLVGFCGRAYPFMYYRESYCYTVEHFQQAIKRPLMHESEYSGHNAQAALKAFKETKTRSYRDLRRPDYATEESWANLLTMDWTVPVELHLELQAPVFVAYYSYPGAQLKTNPRLNLWEFYKVLTPVEAFQRLAQFVGNDMVVQKDPEVGLTDDLRRDSAGFDKWSFRKHRDDPKRSR